MVSEEWETTTNTNNNGLLCVLWKDLAYGIQFDIEHVISRKCYTHNILELISMAEALTLFYQFQMHF